MKHFVSGATMEAEFDGRRYGRTTRLRRLSVFAVSVGMLLSFLGEPGRCRPQTEDMPAVCFTGDVMLARGVGGVIKKKGNDFLFEKILPELSRYKYRFINLECPLTPRSYPPRKLYSFRADTGCVSILRAAGITHATLANNHINDQGVAGASDTYRVLEDNRIVPIGLRSGKADTCLPPEIILGGRKIAVFGALGIDMKSHNVWYSLDSAFLGSVASYKRDNPSAFVVCYIHWGAEYRRRPTARQERIARTLIDSGADMIIGHHPHVVESIRYYKGKPVLYSLGNFIFDQRDAITRKGMVAGLAVLDGRVQVEIMPYNIVEDRPVPMNEDERKKFKETLLKISEGVDLVDDGSGWKVEEAEAGGSGGPKTKRLRRDPFRN